MTRIIKNIIVSLLTIAILCCNSFNSNAQEFKAIQELNVRSATSTKSSIIGIIHKDENVIVTELRNPWGKIVYQGQEGFVSLKFLKATDNVLSKTNNKATAISSNFILIILALIGIILFLLRKTILVRGLFQIISAILKLSKDGARTSDIRISNSSRNNPSIPTRQKTEVRCYSCGVRRNDATNLCNNKNIPHKWKYM